MAVHGDFAWRFERGAALAVLWLTFAACDEAAISPRSVARPLAVVGGHAITAEDVAARVASLPESQRPRDRAGLERLLAELVDLEVLAAEARRRRFEDSAEARGARTSALAEAALGALAGHLPGPEAIPAAAVAAYHAEHLALFSSPEVRRLSAAAFVDRARAEAARRAPESTQFAELGEVAARDGEVVGVMPPGAEIPDALYKAGLALAAVGAISEAVPYEGRMWLVRLEGRTAPETRGLAREEGNIRRRMAQERYESARDAWLAELRARALIRVDEDALREVRATGDLEAYDPARWKQPR
jgi:hypothetical protein